MLRVCHYQVRPPQRRQHTLAPHASAGVKKLRSLQRSSQACIARWAPILLLSLDGRMVQEIAEGMGLYVQTVRQRIRAFNAETVRRLLRKAGSRSTDKSVAPNL